MNKIHNFSAGPCILPQEVMKQAAAAVIELDNTGLSLIEMSHRSAPFVAIMEEARSLVKELLNVPDNYSVLFLQGGASLGFLTVAHNLLKDGETAAYINTGTWAKKATKEAGHVGDVAMIASSEDETYSYIPKEYAVPANASYLHFTSNNTIYGTQYKTFPKVDVPLVCDMSSDIFSREINVSDFALIYGGAQKNMGPAGTVVYIVNNDFLGKVNREIPAYLDLKIHIDKDSMFNTPPVFAIYTSMLFLQWMKKQGGIKAIAKKNEEKAAILYKEIDSNPLFKGHARKEDRSLMNVTFILTDESLSDEFNRMWEEAGISGIKGHRSVGGYRASIYNAMPIESVQVLVDVMKKLALKTA